MLNKILVGSPIADVKAYSILNFVRGINDLDFPKELLTKVFVDTSPHLNWIKQKMEGWIYQKIDINQEKTPDLVHRRLVAACNILREIVLTGDFSHLFLVECDVIVPTSALTKMLDADKDIVQGLYYVDFDFFPPEWWIAGDVLKDAGNRGCLGVALIKKEVLEKISFRYDPNMLKAFHDAFLYADAAKLGFSSVVHCGVICDHLLDPQTQLRGWDKLGLEKPKKEVL